MLLKLNHAMANPINLKIQVNWVYDDAMKKTYFISDLHLDKQWPEITRCFTHFLQQHAYKADALYILGDLFETWIGDDQDDETSKVVIQALRQLGDAGVNCYLMRGNRDFLIGRRFAKACGLTLLNDPTTIDLYGTPTLLMHGDLLCTDDVAYQRFRRFSHNPLLRWLFLRLPLRKRQKIAEKARKKSQQHTQTIDLSIQDVNPQAVLNAFKQSQAKILIHGHTHRPAKHLHRTHQHTSTRYVLAAWHQQGQALAISETGNITSITLPHI